MTRQTGLDKRPVFIYKTFSQCRESERLGCIAIDAGESSLGRVGCAAGQTGEKMGTHGKNVTGSVASHLEQLAATLRRGDDPEYIDAASRVLAGQEDPAAKFLTHDVRLPESAVLDLKFSCGGSMALVTSSRYKRKVYGSIPVRAAGRKGENGCVGFFHSKIDVVFANGANTPFIVESHDDGCFLSWGDSKKIGSAESALLIQDWLFARPFGNPNVVIQYYAQDYVHIEYWIFENKEWKCERKIASWRREAGIWYKFLKVVPRDDKVAVIWKRSYVGGDGGLKTFVSWVDRHGELSEEIAVKGDILDCGIHDGELWVLAGSNKPSEGRVLYRADQMPYRTNYFLDLLPIEGMDDVLKVDCRDGIIVLSLMNSFSEPINSTLESVSEGGKLKIKKAVRHGDDLFLHVGTEAGSEDDPGRNYIWILRDIDSGKSSCVVPSFCQVHDIRLVDDALMIEFLVFGTSEHVECLFWKSLFGRRVRYLMTKQMASRLQCVGDTMRTWVSYGNHLKIYEFPIN